MRLAARPLARGGLFIVLASCPLLIHLMLSAHSRAGSGTGDTGLVGISLVATAAIVHAFVYVVLLTIFGVTLLPGREPLVTWLARKMHGAIPAEMTIYTRGVTWAWCCFFAGQLGTSLALFLWAPVVAWSLFVNVLNVPLLAAMFAAEHAYRMVHLPNPPRYTAADFRRMVGFIRESVSKRVRSR